MLKLASIAVLLAAGALSAWLTRPNHDSFKESRLSRLENQSTFYRNYMSTRLEADLKTCQFHDHIFCVDVEQRGKVIYSGLLGHWIERNIQKRF